MSVGRLDRPRIAALERLAADAARRDPRARMNLDRIATELLAAPDNAVIRIGTSNPGDADGPPHVALLYVEILFEPTVARAVANPDDAEAQRRARRALVEIDWYRSHLTSDPTPSDEEFDRLAEMALETREARAGVGGQPPGFSSHSPTPDGAVAYRPPVVRRRPSF